MTKDMKSIKIIVTLLAVCSPFLLFFAHIPVYALSIRGTAEFNIFAFKKATVLQTNKDQEIEFLVTSAEEIELFLEEYSRKLEYYNAKKSNWSNALKQAKKKELNAMKIGIISFFEQLWGDVHVFEEDDESISESFVLLNKHLEKTKEKSIQFGNESAEKCILGLIDKLKILSQTIN